MSARAAFFFGFAILIGGTTAKESKSTKRQVQYIGQRRQELDPGLDPRQRFAQDQQFALVDPRTGRLVDPRIGRLVDPSQVDPRTGRLVDPSQVDPAQLQAFQLGFVPRQPQQEVPPEYAQLLRLIGRSQGGVQAIPQQVLQQSLASRGPQRFSGQPASAPVRLTQEQIEQNQVQEGIATKDIREQEARDAQRLQELQFLQHRGISPEILREYQPQLIPGGQHGGDPRLADAQQRQAQAEAHARAQAEAQAKAQAEAQQRQAQARAQAEEQARAQAEEQARAQAEEQARAQAEAQARTQAEAQARAQAEADKRAQADEENRREEQSRAIAATLAARAQLEPSHKPAAQLRQPQYAAEPIPDSPEQISYSTVQFGSSKLPQPPRIFTSQPLTPRQLIYKASHPNAPQPSPLPEYVEIPQQQSIYKQKIQYNPEDYSEAPAHPGIPEVIVKDRQTPNQYLIETTNFEANARPINVQPALRKSQGSIAAQRVAEQRARAIYTQQALEAATTPSPSHSRIFVTTSRTPALRAKPQEPEVHQQGGRPLTQGELKALLNAGYKVHPHPQQQPAYEEPTGVTYYQRGARLGKRQDKPVPKPVPLTEDERRALAREGIRGLYRIEPAGTEEESNAKYVLAIGKPFPSH